MLDIDTARARIEDSAENLGLTLRTGISEKSDSVYITLTKPKEVSREYGVMSNHEVLVRLANHYKHTNTGALLDADLYINVQSQDELDVCLQDVADYFANATTQETE